MFFSCKKQIFQTGFYHRIIKRNQTHESKSKEEKDMSILENLKGKVKQEMEQREQLKAYVENHKGTEAICAYMTCFFDKGDSGYYWLKENKIPLYPVVQESRVQLCYMWTGKAQSFKDVIPKDVPVKTIYFNEMYEWYGLNRGEGYQILNTRVERKTLEMKISQEVQKLPHIKYSTGFLVKMFC